MNGTGGEVNTGAVGLVGFIFIFLLALMAFQILRFLFNVIFRRSNSTNEPEWSHSETRVVTTHRPPTTPSTPSTVTHKMVNYQYSRRTHFMTKHERDFFGKLFHAVGRDYLIFAQIHLDRILDARSYRQYHEAAQKAIRTFSVDFVLCDTDLRIICALELDDSTHLLEHRRKRDEAVNRVFERAGLPLLRIPLNKQMRADELRARIGESIHEYN